VTGGGGGGGAPPAPSPKSTADLTASDSDTTSDTAVRTPDRPTGEDSAVLFSFMSPHWVSLSLAANAFRQSCICTHFFGICAIL